MSKILLFAGSNNPKSINQTVINSVAGMIDEDKRTVINLRDYQLPVYSFELEAEGIPEKAKALRKIIDEHNNFVIAVPEHNGSVSAFFKNTLDWLSRVEKGYKLFTDKRVALISVSPVGGTANALSHAEVILKRLGATITDAIGIPKFFEETITTEKGLHFKDEELYRKLRNLAKNISEQEPQPITI
jgi:chromate reductase